jgi:hypothetical protein
MWIPKGGGSSPVRFILGRGYTRCKAEVSRPLANAEAALGAAHPSGDWPTGDWPRSAPSGHQRVHRHRTVISVDNKMLQYVKGFRLADCILLVSSLAGYALVNFEMLAIQE